MSGINVFSTLGQSFNNAAITFVSSKMAAVTAVAAPIALAGVSLYIVIYGYLIITGRVQQPFYDFCIKCVKIIIVAAFSVAGSYASLAGTIEGFQQDMLSAIGDSGDIYGTLDNAANSGIELLRNIEEKRQSIGWNQVGTHITYFGMFLVIGAAYLLLLVGVGITVMVAMLFLKILLALGPIFVMCLMFPPVSRFFDNWFGAVMSNLFVTVIGSAVASLALQIFTKSFGKIDLNSTTVSPWSAVFGILAMSIVLFVATRSVASLAAGLGGGVASEAVSAGQAMAAAIGFSQTSVRSADASAKLAKKGWNSGKKTFIWAKGKFGRRNSMKEAPPPEPAYNRTQKYN